MISIRNAGLSDEKEKFELHWLLAKLIDEILVRTGQRYDERLERLGISFKKFQYYVLNFG
jgi:hypothetical protein